MKRMGTGIPWAIYSHPEHETLAFRSGRLVFFWGGMSVVTVSQIVKVRQTIEAF